jgi:hypothetical protein
MIDLNKNQEAFAKSTEILQENVKEIIDNNRPSGQKLFTRG